MIPAVGAYLAWGLFPLYWKQLGHVPPIEILGHRVVWSFVFVAILVSWQRRWPEFLRTLTTGRTLAPMLVTTTLISGNWFLFIWAVNSGHVTQASLGYYINPLLNVLFARVFLGEKLRPAKLVAVALAGAGVTILAIGEATIPWVALTLATTFALYGLVRKVAPVEPLTALSVETGLVMPLAATFLIWNSHQTGAPVLGASARDTAFLLGTGIATALPLLWFAIGAKRLRYSTMGIIQYLAPTGQLACAVLVYGEPFTERHAFTFALIWAAVILYAADGIRAGRRSARPPDGAEAEVSASA
ncbi:Protein rarD [Vulgatibacter incomptus]|uniref:Protein rarD n=1 Tax=Vulgatibacter incomptus TaxID=1391653 RepID=A0A0K1PHR8_9BACT|nr:Protein rarD [Vulgatibacter incomptus]